MARYSIPALLDHTGSSHCVIEASAGTGKTFTLEHLLVDLILQGVPLESILVVTYTRKAALELTGRVRKIIARLASLPADAVIGEGPWRPLGEEGTALLRKALTGFDAATISTIHAFCRQVLDDAAFEGGHLFQQENASSDDLFDRAFTVMLRTEYGKAQRDLLELALESSSEGRKPLRGLLRDALREADNLDLPEFRDLGAFLAGFPEDLAQAFIQVRADLHAGFPGGHADIQALLEQILARRAEALASGRPAAFWKDREWAGTILPKGLAPFRASVLEGDAARLGDAVAALANVRAVLVAAFLPPLREELRRHKAEAGLYDFDDMINLVVRALESPHGGTLVKRLRERFQVALIDEFQDTNRQQWTIFSKVFLDTGEGHRLFLVGDPKQAIYGFQGGDLPTFQQALREVKRNTGRDPLSLNVNFRSTQAVIDGCNAILEETDGASFFTGQNAGLLTTPVACGRKQLSLTGAQGDSLPAIQVVDVFTDGKVREVNLMAAACLARALKETLATGRYSDPDRMSPELRYEDVFVLAAKKREGRAMARALKAEGIPAALYREDGLFDGIEAEACRDLLLAIESPLDEARRAKALLGPFFGLSFAESERARELPEGHPILSRLFSWQELAKKGRFGELLSRVASESGMSQRLLFLDGRQRVLTNLLHILELLQKKALAGHCTLADLAIQVQRWIDDKDRPAVEDGTTQRLERQSGAVQILTMHKSKGLQAPLVVLFGGTSGSRASEIHRYHGENWGPRRAWAGPVNLAPPGIRTLIGNEEAEEGERLAYVALTRAEAQVILPRYVVREKNGRNFDEDGNPRKGMYLAINRRLQALLGPHQAPRAAAGMARSAAREQIPEPEEPARRPWTVPDPAPLALPAFSALLERGRPVWMFNYTGLQKGVERGRAEAGVFEEVKELAPPGGPGGGKRLGTQVHAMLETVDPASFAGRDLEAWMALPATVDLAGDLPKEDRKEVLRWVHHAMTHPLPLPGGGALALFQAEEMLREMDFVTPYPGLPDYLNGSIDVLFQDGGRAHVLDWKTNLLRGYDPAALDEAVQAHYLLQVKIYSVTACRFLGIRDVEHYERAFGGVVYVFLRGLPEGGVWTCRPSWDELRAWERDLENLRPDRWILAQTGGAHHV